MEVIRGEEKIVVEYEVRFFYDRDGGFAFPCDSKGNLFEMEQAAKNNYKYCIENPSKFKIYNEIHRTVRKEKEPDTGKCDVCGKEMIV